MKKLRSTLFEDIDDEIQQDELRGFARSVAEVEWLLLILVLLYLVTPGTVVTERGQVTNAVIGFGIFIIAFRYLNFYRRDTRLKITIEILAMIGLPPPS